MYITKMHCYSDRLHFPKTAATIFSVPPALSEPHKGMASRSSLLKHRQVFYLPPQKELVDVMLRDLRRLDHKKLCIFCHPLLFSLIPTLGH